jgi:hypothetical protein
MMWTRAWIDLLTSVLPAASQRVGPQMSEAVRCPEKTMMDTKSLSSSSDTNACASALTWYSDPDMLAEQSRSNAVWLKAGRMVFSGVSRRTAIWRPRVATRPVNSSTLVSKVTP